MSIRCDNSLEFDNCEKIKDVKVPVLIIYGENDMLPEYMSLNLFNAVPNNKKYYWKVKNGSHCDTYKVQPEIYTSMLSKFISECKD